MQLAFFVAQETIEGSAVGQLFLWGMLGQLPVALAGALGLRWLAARLGPALDGLRVRCEAPVQLLAITTVRWPAPVPALVLAHRLAGPITRRGPPSF
jgi:hypothetical protein